VIAEADANANAAADLAGALRRAAGSPCDLFVHGIADQALVLLDLDGRILSWNRGARTLFGYSAAEAIGQHCRWLLPLEQPRAERSACFDTAANEGRCQTEGWRLRKDGSQFWGSETLTALRDETGTLLGFGQATRDSSGVLGPDELFRRTLEAAPTGMMLSNPQGNIVLVNAEIERLFGYTRRELIGRPVETLVPARFRQQHGALRGEFQDDPSSRRMGAGRELYGVRKDGSEAPVAIGLNPLRIAAGDFVLSSVVDISDQKRAERERSELMNELRGLNTELEQRVLARTSALEAALAERNVLLQEVHHRVKNNLSVVVSLLEMQARLLGPGAGWNALEDCRGRVHAIALIHENLYQSQNFSDVPFADYIRGLANDVFSATGTSPSAVSLQLSVDAVTIAVDKAIPCALIVNELISNSLKHGFPGGRPGTIRVELKKLNESQLRLVVDDDGIGLQGDPLGKATTLGLKLVTTLAKQLDGVVEAKSEGPGARFELTFPIQS
jgi:PAS domain S-box-containing protein